MMRPVRLIWYLNRRAANATLLKGDPRKALKDIPVKLKNLGAGIDRRAWRLGDYVIKRQSAWSPKRPPLDVLKRLKLLPPQQWFVNGWVIQVYYPPIKDRCPKWLWKDGALDTSGWNIGLDKKGRRVIFDW